MIQNKQGRTQQTLLSLAASYGLAAASTALSALARWLFPAALTPAPYLGFYPAVVISALFGGVGPGLVATFASLFLVNFVFGRFNIHDHGAVARQVIWVIASVGVTVLAGRQRAARMREVQQAELLRRLNDELEIRVQERTAELRAANIRLQEQVEAISQADVLLEKNEELTRLNRAMVGRELRMIELKEEVNTLCAKAGLPLRYSLDDKG